MYSNEDIKTKVFNGIFLKAALLILKNSFHPEKLIGWEFPIRLFLLTKIEEERVKWWQSHHLPVVAIGFIPYIYHDASFSHGRPQQDYPEVGE